MKLFRVTFIAGLLATLLSVQASAATSLGIFQNEDRTSQYELALCGPNEQALCVTVLSARGPDGQEATGFVGTAVINQAAPAGPNRWKGKMVIGEKVIDTTISLEPGQKAVMNLCMLFLCKDVTLRILE